MIMNFFRQSHRTAARLLLAFASGLMLTVALPAHAVKNTGGEYNTLYAGQGAKGYDVVAYFTDGKPVQGSDEYTSEYGGVVWKFASKQHLEMFKASPAKYAPQYGGFCSWGVANGRLFDVDPVNGWTIQDGKLYLNFNADINKTFRQSSADFIKKAEANWQDLNR
jgi:YHS domain-containing protein